MSPEQISAQKMDALSNLFSFGVYELMSSILKGSRNLSTQRLCGFHCHFNASYKCWHDALKSARIADRIRHDARRSAAIRRDAAGLSRDGNMRFGGWR